MSEQNNIGNNKRIAKNTMMLYIRMMFMMLIGLYTSRVILDKLGEIDFGIYNVVGGFVSMFSIFNSGLISATQRFLTFELGKGDKKALRETYSSCMHIYIMISLIVIIFAETFGLWFIGNKMIIPPDRMTAAYWVFQFSLLTFVVALISNPQQSLIIAHEKMSTFAYISIFEAIAKLVIVYMLAIGDTDKLILYAIFMFLVQLSLRLIYGIYCKCHYDETKMIWSFNWMRIKEIYGFTGWAMLGGFSVIGRTQGLNMLLNLFFGPVVNAARGISVQVLNAVNSFVANFQTALNPQIIKSYAQNDMKSMYKLIFYSSKISFLLLFILSLPLFLETEYILSVWLKKTPVYSVAFIRLLLFISMIDAISNPITRAIEATGKVRTYQLVAGTMMIAILPISYIFLKLGYDAPTVYWITMIMNAIVLLFRIILAERLVHLNIYNFIWDVLFRCSCAAILCIPIPYYLHTILSCGFTRLLLVSIIAFICVIMISYFVVLNANDRKSIFALIRKRTL